MQCSRAHRLLPWCADFFFFLNGQFNISACVCVCVCASVKDSLYYNCIYTYICICACAPDNHTEPVRAVRKSTYFQSVRHPEQTSTVNQRKVISTYILYIYRYKVIIVVYRYIDCVLGIAEGTPEATCAFYLCVRPLSARKAHCCMSFLQKRGIKNSETNSN